MPEHSSHGQAKFYIFLLQKEILPILTITLEIASSSFWIGAPTPTLSAKTMDQDISAPV